MISNNFTDKNYELEKVNYFFKGDIELYIISILWILEEGYTLHKDYSKDNFAYFLELNSENGRVEDGLRLFKPYFEQYQKWRDTGIDIAKSVLDKDIDVVIISLDIKEYYYNITFDPNLIEKMEGIIRERSNSNSVLLTPMIFEINDRYSKVFPNKDKRKSVLPIGLLSSGILANWYLNDFDNLIKSELSPAYYGRYVDDIQIVLSNTKIPKEVKGKTFNSSLEFFMDKFFVKRKIFNSNIDERKKNEKIPLIYRYTLNNDIEIQKDKIAVYSFESKESRAVLDMFKKKIEQNSSAFWFLPNEDDISNDFDESVYELTYSDTINKLRSVVDIKQSKYGASIFLAKKIKVSLLSDSSKDEKTTEQILTFFKGIVNLEFSSMWEKVLTYFVISNDKEAFWSFLKETLSSIDKIKNSSETKLNGDTINKVKKYLGEYLINCCSLSLALNPNFINVNTWENRCSNYNFKWLEKKFSFPYKSINDYIFSNLLRNSLVVVPLLNYLEIVSKDKVNLVNYNFLLIVRFLS